MATNFAERYANTGYSIATEQSFFIVEESTKATLTGPQNEDFIFTREGASVNRTQAFNPDEHRSGRQNFGVIFEKKQAEWSIPLYINVDTAAAQGVDEVEPGVRVLMKNLLGREQIPGGVVYDNGTEPDFTFSVFENGFHQAKQAFGGFAQTLEVEAPGDGDAGMTVAGNAADMIRVGIGQSTVDNTGGNTITLQTGEAKRFPVGALVMIVESDGLTRSADTDSAPTQTYRTVTANDGDAIVTLDGAVLADADGSGTPIYLCFAEPPAPASFSDIQSGLVGTITIAGQPFDCFRNFSLSFNNNHELEDYCFGLDRLGDNVFIPGNKMDISASFEVNLDQDLIEFLNDLNDFPDQVASVIIGDSAGRHFRIDMARLKFQIPADETPASGSIPVTLEAELLQTTRDAKDALVISYL